MSFRKATLLVAVLLGSLLFFLLPPAGSQAALGTNLGGINYWDGVVPFRDLVRQGGEWIGRGPLEVDRRGWPKKVDEPLSMALAELRYPAGTYRVSWQGEGQFRVGGKLFSGRAGIGQVSLDGSSLVLLEILNSNRQNYLRDIRVLAPGEGLFREAYIRSLSPYRVLRFMDWQKTNGTFSDPVPALSCKNRVRADFISQGRRRGASVFWMVRLANRLGAEPWFTVPHKADASWITCHSRYVARYLRKDLRPRYEFSNETWNPAFEQFFDLTPEGGDFTDLQAEAARRHMQMSRIIDKEIPAKRWISVLAGQAANSWVLQQRLLRASADQIAIAPYMHLPGRNPYDPAEANEIASWTEAELFLELRASLEEEVRPWIRDHMALGKRVIAYEGGQHLAGVSSNDALTDLFISANRSNQMGELYQSYLQLWQEETGGALFVHYLDAGPYSRFGSWGAVEYPGQEGSGKYQALFDFASGP